MLDSYGCGYLSVGSQLMGEGGAHGETKNGLVIGYLLGFGLGNTI